MKIPFLNIWVTRIDYKYYYIDAREFIESQNFFISTSTEDVDVKTEYLGNGKIRPIIEFKVKQNETRI